MRHPARSKDTISHTQSNKLRSKIRSLSTYAEGCTKANRMPNKISESELNDYFQNKAVKKLHIVQCEGGGYRTVVNLTWKEGDFEVITTRGKPREWASLDRLARHIQEKYQGVLPTMSLTFIE